MKQPDPPRPDSDAIRIALLPARIAHWRKAGTAPDLVAKLEAELEQATADDDRKDTP